MRMLQFVKGFFKGGTVVKGKKKRGSLNFGGEKLRSLGVETSLGSESEAEVPKNGKFEKCRGRKKGN